MPIPVKLSDVVNEMDVMCDEHRAYINRRTGELVTLTEEEMQGAESYEELEDEEDLEEDEVAEGIEEAEDLEWDERRVKKVLESDDYIQLPDKFEIHEWSIMEQFSESVENDLWRDELLRAIHGSGAFRYFKDTISRLGIREDWYGFREEALREIARDFLVAEEIPFVEDGG